MTTLPRILITPGEPAGIGPDITLALANETFAAELIVIADPEMLQTRAAMLQQNINITLIETLSATREIHQPGMLRVYPLATSARVVPGQLNKANAAYVYDTLKIAANWCVRHEADAIVTGPVQKSILNDAGIIFSGHTEFFAENAAVKKTVMLFVTDAFKVALATTHLPLARVPSAITQELLFNVIEILHHDLQHKFHLAHPRILVCGLNPHAGENGYLGHEEIDVIAPTINALKSKGILIEGPLSADTIFTPKYLNENDVILAMYHDQALPLVKYASFGHAVNVTLGLPYVRTSVDHGTALDVAGSGRADAASLIKACELAITLSKKI